MEMLVYSEVSNLIRRAVKVREAHVLEAGCGSATHIDLPDHWLVTGVDISAEQLERNTTLDEKILGDLQSIQFTAEFDAAICWNVLEHLDDPAAALGNIATALRPGGILVIGVPLATSFKGWVTKLSPHWFHVAVGRYVLGSKTAGLPGYWPFPNYMRMEITPKRLRNRLSRLCFREIYTRRYSTSHYIKFLTRYGLLSWLIRFLASMVWLFSLGRVSWKYSDFVGVYQKQEN